MSTHNIGFCGEIRKLCGYPFLFGVMSFERFAGPSGT